MIRRIQALGYRCLRYVDVRLDRFHVLVGPNASGKSALFDVVALLSDLVEDGLEAAVEQRTRNFQDLVWGRPNQKCGFELAMEFDLPQEVKGQLPAARDFRVFRYELELAISEDDEDVLIDSERGILMPEPKPYLRRMSLFPDPLPVPDTVLMGKLRGIRTILSKSRQGRDTFNVEVSERSGARWVTSVSFGPRRSALGNLPESSEKFPAATYVKQIMQRGIKPLFLDSVKMRQASPPHLCRTDFSPNGSNLPWALADLKVNHGEDYGEWLRHVQTILCDLEDIHVAIRPDDRHAYLMLLYETGTRVPSWVTAEGVLRFLALTLLAYLPNSDDVYLLEEPENGVHPLGARCSVRFTCFGLRFAGIGGNAFPYLPEARQPGRGALFCQGLRRGDGRHPWGRPSPSQAPARYRGHEPVVRDRCCRMSCKRRSNDLVVLAADTAVSELRAPLRDWFPASVGSTT